jgi:hypothetical protein
MILKEFIRNFIEPNTLIRLWYKLPKGTDGIHEEVMEGDNPKMEHELLKSEYKDYDVIGVTDILYVSSPYIEAVNIVLKK